jgi:hypothetical protein
MMPLKQKRASILRLPKQVKLRINPTLNLELAIKDRIKQLQDQRLKAAGTWIIPQKIQAQIKELRWVLKLLKYQRRLD